MNDEKEEEEEEDDDDIDRQLWVSNSVDNIDDKSASCIKLYIVDGKVEERFELPIDDAGEEESEWIMTVP